MTKAQIMQFPAINRYRPDNAAVLTRLYRDFAASEAGPEWLKGLRTSALTVVEEHGLPTPKLERWKFTNLSRALKADDFRLTKADIKVEGPHTRFADILADAPEWLQTFLNAPVQDDYGFGGLWHLSNAFLRDGIIIDVPKNERAEVSITITAQDKDFIAPRLIIRLAQGAEATVVERHRGAGHYWKNMATQIEVADNARLHHYRVQGDALDAVYTQNTHITLGRDAHYDATNLAVGARLSRNQITVEMNGPGGQCDLNGVNILRGQQHGDATMLIEHKAPNCNSRQFVRSVLDGQAHGVYQGKVHVHREGQKSDGYQLSNAIILSEGAEMDTKPELEIYADDVKCSHGATTGRLDAEPMFYMRSRGIDEATARSLLIEAFLAEVLEHVNDEAVREEMQAGVQKWLAE